MPRVKGGPCLAVYFPTHSTILCHGKEPYITEQRGNRPAAHGSSSGARRRRLSAAYKLRVLREADVFTEGKDAGSLLHGEGL